MIHHCYIHIPFCNNICSYCDFCKMFYHEQSVDLYLAGLEKEIQSIYHNDCLKTIYIGGGTPSCLSLSQLEHLFQILDVFQKEKDYEFTIEGNLDSITEEKLSLFQRHGINRISIGIETIHPRNLEFLERNFSRKECLEKVSMMRKMGFHNINFDLIYAIPGESLSILREDLSFLLSLKPEHISTYSLMIEDHTKLSIHGVKPVSDEMDEKMYHLIQNTLNKNGYQHYEISNYSLKGYESLHNLGYWKNEEYYGFGLGACSYLSPYRYMNTRSLNRYQVDPILEKEYVSLEDKIEYEIMLGLRLIEGIDLDLFFQKYSKSLLDLYSCDDLIQYHFLELNNHYLRIPEGKLYVSNEIIVKLLQNKKEL